MRWFPYGLLSSYPHLTEREATIWSRFIFLRPEAFDECAYDVVCGGTRPNEEELRPEYEANRDYLGRYKIDVLAKRDNQLYIIEIKHEATTKALGEVWLYEHCFMRDYQPTEEVRTMIVTDQEMPDMKEICLKENVAYEIV